MLSERKIKSPLEELRVFLCTVLHCGWDYIIIRCVGDALDTDTAISMTIAPPGER
jgi:hypothetical protein